MLKRSSLYGIDMDCFISYFTDVTMKKISALQLISCHYRLERWVSQKLGHTVLLLSKFHCFGIGLKIYMVEQCGCTIWHNPASLDVCTLSVCKCLPQRLDVLRMQQPDKHDKVIALAISAVKSLAYPWVLANAKELDCSILPKEG